MDTLAHALWGVTIVRRKNLFWWLLLFGALPDLLTSAYGLLRFGPESVLIFGGFKKGILPPAYYQFYFLTHSFFTAGLIFFAFYFLKRKYTILVVPYFFHILCDIPFHCGSFSTRFLYPLSDFHLCGISYSANLSLKVVNYLMLILINLLILKIRKEKASLKEKGN